MISGTEGPYLLVCFEGANVVETEFCPRKAGRDLFDVLEDRSIQSVYAFDLGLELLHGIFDSVKLVGVEADPLPHNDHAGCKKGTRLVSIVGYEIDKYSRLRDW